MKVTLLGAVAGLALLAAVPARASLLTYDVTGTVGDDTLSGTLTWDTTLPANGLAPVYSSISLTLTGSQAGPGGPIGGTFNTVSYWPAYDQAGPYMVDAPADWYTAVVQSDGGFTDYTHAGTYTGYSSFMGLYIGYGTNGNIPESPAALGSTPFMIIENEEYVIDGTPQTDNPVFGTAQLTLASGVPEPATWAMMLIGFAGVGLAGMRIRRKSPAGVA